MPLIYGMPLYQSCNLCKYYVLPTQLKVHSILNHCRLERPKVFQTVLVTIPVCLNFKKNISLPRINSLK